MASPVRSAYFAGVCIVILAAAGLRLFDLGGKVIHADESVQAWKTGELLQTGNYRYDPEDHHGPTLYFAAAAWSWITGERSVGALRIGRLRLIPACAGLALVILTLGFGAAIGWRAALLAGAFTASSPLLVYYSRHFIQESLLVLFSFAAIVAGWHWQQTRRLRWAAGTGALIGLMIATKETWLIHAAALGIGCLTVRPRRNEPALPGDRARFARQGVVAVLVLMAVSAALYSSFFTRPEALLDLGRGIVRGIQRAGDSVHAKPWYTYLGMLTWSTRGPYHWSEAAIGLLGVAALPVIRTQPVIRFLASYAVALLLIYSLVPYKTPWLACSFWHPIAVLAGCGAARLVGPRQPHAIRTVSAGLLVLILAQLGWQAHRAAGPLAGNSRNPYGYVETSRDILRLPTRLETLVAVHPEDETLDIVVAVQQVWPLPWFLRDVPHVRYEPVEKPALAADVLLVSPEVFATLPIAVQERFGTELFGLREGEIVILAVERTLWELSLSTPAQPL